MLATVSVLAATSGDSHATTITPGVRCSDLRPLIASAYNKFKAKNFVPGMAVAVVLPEREIRQGDQAKDALVPLPLRVRQPLHVRPVTEPDAIRDRLTDEALHRGGVAADARAEQDDALGPLQI